LTELQVIYHAGNETVRSILNRAIVTKLYADGRKVSEHELSEPFDVLHEAHQRHRIRHDSPGNHTYHRHNGALLKDPDPGKAFPSGEIYLSMPGLGDRLAARVAGEIGDHIHQYDSPNALQCYAGSAPVTRRSGKSDFVVARRLAHNHHLSDAIHQWAFCLTHSAWAREFYDEKITAGKSHHNALSNRWLKILWHCLTKGVLYNEATHQANRNRDLRHAT
jgi:hypothetical protein